MKTQFEASNVRVSWTKYDVVHVVDLMESKDAFLSYYRGEGDMNGAVLRAFLGINSLKDPLPDFWYNVFECPYEDRQCFAFFWFVFSHIELALTCIKPIMQSPFKGVFVTNGTKQATNLRSLLVESRLTSTMYRRKKEVPFDGSRLLNSSKMGMAFKDALENLIRRNTREYYENEFYDICYQNDFHGILGLSPEEFRRWTQGEIISGDWITSLSFTNFLCYNSSCKLDFHSSSEPKSPISKEIYFLGENGDGKTVLLYALFAAFKSYRVLSENQITEIAALKKLVTETNLKGVDNLMRSYTLDNAPEFKNFFAYGTHRGRYSAETTDSSSSYEKDGFMTLFDNNLTLRDPSDWLRSMHMSPIEHRNLSLDGLKRVLSELLENKVEIKISEGNVVEYYEKGYKLTLKELSEGYRSVLIFVCDLLSKLSDRCPKEADVFFQHGVVLVDEIDQHLHPKWQLTIVRKLRKLFPNIQFIMTTHSPVMVMGSSEDAIFFRVTRTDGRTSVSDPYYRSTMDKFMMNTLITSSLFDLDSAAMNPHALDADTSSDLISSKIHKAVRKRIEEDKRSGKWNYTEAAIDSIISEVMKDYDTHK